MSTQANASELSASNQPELSHGTKSRFRYKPLDVGLRQIRVIILEPRSQNSTEPLRCTIRHVSLDDDSLQYEAISYYWGNPTPSSPMEIDGLDHLLPINSALALQRMALPDAKRTLWIDSACINQADTAERSHQITLMRDIFRKASAVLVHLKGNDFTERAIANINLLQKEIDDDIGPETELISITEAEARDHHTYRKPIRSQVDLDALKAFFGQRWFRRVWVVQEVALATKAICVCGPCSLDMDTVLRVPYWITSWHSSTVASSLTLRLRTSSRMYMARAGYATRGPSTIESLLRMSLGLEASDVRDKVFGTLALLDSKYFHPSLAPDYKRPSHLVVRDAVRRCFLGGTPLRILRALSHRTEDDLWAPHTPSWMPQYHREYARDLDTNSFASRGNPLGRVDLAQKLAEEFEQPDVLELQGIVLGKIVETVGPLAQRSGRCKMKMWLRQIDQALEGYNPNDDSLARTIMGDTNHLKQRSTSQDRLDLCHFRDFVSQSRRVPHIKELTKDTPDAERSVACFSRAVYSACKNRKFAITERAGIGIVPQLSGPGDVVVMVHGGQVPFVLRPCGKHYFMLGECYLDGYMVGQELYKQLAGDLMNEPAVEFTIR